MLQKHGSLLCVERMDSKNLEKRLVICQNTIQIFNKWIENYCKFDQIRLKDTGYGEIVLVAIWILLLTRKGCQQFKKKMLLPCVYFSICSKISSLSQKISEKTDKPFRIPLQKRLFTWIIFPWFEINWSILFSDIVYETWIPVTYWNLSVIPSK